MCNWSIPQLAFLHAILEFVQSEILNMREVLFGCYDMYNLVDLHDYHGGTLNLGTLVPKLGV